MRGLCLRRVQTAGEVRRAGRVAGGKEERRREEGYVFGWDARGRSVRCRVEGGGRVRSAGARGWNGKCRGMDKKRGILVALCAVERVVPQPIGSDSSWPRGIGNMSVQVMPGFRPTSRCCRNLNYNASRRCATETVGLVLSCLPMYFLIFLEGDVIGTFEGSHFWRANFLIDCHSTVVCTGLSINASLHGYAPTHGCSSTSALVQTSSPRKRFAVRPSHRRNRHESCRPALIFRSSSACTRHSVGLCKKISTMPGGQVAHVLSWDVRPTLGRFQ